MKTPLHLYTKEAFDILKDCFFYEATRNPLTVAIALDGELHAERYLHAPDKAPPVDIGTVVRYLEKYAEWRNSSKYNKSAMEVVSNAELAVKAKCVRLIVLGKDESAKKRYPAEYELLKGKPMNPLQSAAVSALTQELSKLDEEIAHDFSKYGHYWHPRFSDFDFKRRVEELVDKIKAIRGY